MAKKVITCDLCGEVMIPAKKFLNGKHKKSGHSYGIIRYKCSNYRACDFQKTVFSSDANYTNNNKLKTSNDSEDDDIIDNNDIDDDLDIDTTIDNNDEDFN